MTMETKETEMELEEKPIKIITFREFVEQLNEKFNRKTPARRPKTVKKPVKQDN